MPNIAVSRAALTMGKAAYLVGTRAWARLRVGGAPTDDPGAERRARALGAARIGWLAVVLPAVTVYVASLPNYLARMGVACAGDVCVPGQLAPAQVALLERLSISLATYAALVVWSNVALALVWFGVGALIFWRRADDWMALLVSLVMMLVGAATPADQTLFGWQWPLHLVNFLAVVLLFLVFCLFPSGRFVPRWLWWLPIAYVALSALDFFPEIALPLVDWLMPLHVALLFGCIAVLGGAQIYRFRRISSQLERQQTKWVVFGSTATIVGEVIYWGATLLLQPLGRPVTLYDLLFSPISIIIILCIPLSLSMAILRAHLYAIDLIINRSLVYLTLTGILAGVYAGSIILLQQGFHAVSGQTSPLAIVASTLVIAALFQPLRRRIQRLIDRRFYRRRFNAARLVARFGASVRDEVDLAQLTGHLITTVHDTLQPAHVSLWLRPAVWPHEPLEPPGERP